MSAGWLLIGVTNTLMVWLNNKLRDMSGRGEATIYCYYDTKGIQDMLDEYVAKGSHIVGKALTVEQSRYVIINHFLWYNLYNKISFIQIISLCDVYGVNIISSVIICNLQKWKLCTLIRFTLS